MNDINGTTGTADTTGTNLTCGVALCTFNGQQYLQAQLDSIAAQSVLPDRIVVCDDGSTDGTWALLMAWQARCLMPVSLHRNTQRQNVTANFAQAIERLDTDLIFLCDQDDIWLPDKVARMRQAFQEDPQILLVHSDAELIDGDGRALGKTLLGELAVDAIERAAIHCRRAFEVLVRRNVITGATTAIRRSLLAQALPMPRGFFHDEWLGFVACLTGRVALLDEATIRYRQHGGNVVGVRRLPWHMVLRQYWWQINKPDSREDVRRTLMMREVLFDRIARRSLVRPDQLPALQEAVAFARFRSAPPQRSVVRTAHAAWHLLCGKYWRSTPLPFLEFTRDVINR